MYVVLQIPCKNRLSKKKNLALSCQKRMCLLFGNVVLCFARWLDWFFKGLKSLVVVNITYINRFIEILPCPFLFAALISQQLDQRQKLEQRLEQGKSELQSLTRNAHGLKVLLEARTKFIQTGGVVDVSLCKKVFSHSVMSSI